MVGEVRHNHLNQCGDVVIDHRLAGHPYPVEHRRHRHCRPRHVLSACAAVFHDLDAWLPNTSLVVLDPGEGGRVGAFVVNAVVVEQFAGGEGAMAAGAVRAIDAVPALSAGGAADRQPAGLVFRHES